MSDKPLISVVAPCFNEEDVVPQFHEQLRAVLDGQAGCRFEIIFVDDGSEDSTLPELLAIRERDPRVKVYSLARNFGHQIALSAGLDHAEGDAVIIMDSDLQHPPELVPRLIELWRDGYDVVSPVRQTTEGVSWLKKAASSLFYKAINAISTTQIRPGVSDFCLLSKQAHRALLSMPESNRFLRAMVAWIGYRRTFVPYVAPARAAGKSKYTFRKMVELSLAGTVSFSDKPLRLAVHVGALVTAIGFLYLLYAVGSHFLGGDTVPGWTSLVCTVLILGGMQLLFLGVMAEYLASAFREVKRRPLYFLKEAGSADPAGPARDTTE